LIDNLQLGQNDLGNSIFRLFELSELGDILNIILAVKLPIDANTREKINNCIVLNEEKFSKELKV
tara:strand:- start:478 stop:672 length:195 start_codon:yes stop_codon:yes gene_type:complete